MPIHLTPMTRREFLSRSAGAGAVLVLSGWAGGEADPKRKADPNRFALLSDTHVAADPKAVLRRVNMTDHFRKAAEEAAALKVRPAAAIFGGDLALLKGLPSDYRQFAPILKRLTDAGLAVHLALGNHDHRKNFHTVLAEHKAAKAVLAGRHVSVVESPRVNWFLLDSLEATNVTPGRLGAEQLAWLAKALDARKDKPAIVLAHHDPHKPPPPQPGKPKRKMNGLRDVDALFELLAPRRHVKAYVYGHRHRWWHGKHDGLHLVDIPAVSYVFGKGQPSGWLLADARPDGMDLELRCIDTKHKAHGQKVRLDWRT